MKIDFTGKKAVVSICARDAATLDETRAEIARHGHRVHAAKADLADGEAVRGYVREAIAAQGSVVNISSIAAFHPAARQPPYGAIKAAAVHYTATQAALYARDRIRVNCIAPGSIEFPGGIWDRRKTEDPKLYNATLASIPFGRMGHAEEIASVALFLASPYASWVTGQAISVAGGQGL